MGQTVIEKIWNQHRIRTMSDGQNLMHIDRIALHDRSGPRVLRRLAELGRAVANPELVLGTMDHIIDTFPGRTGATLFANGKEFIGEFRQRARQAAIKLHDIGDATQGISHVITPEQGFALPGATLVCTDSHTCTIGGLGAMAWGIGVTEAVHAVATQTLVRPTPRQMRIALTGRRKVGTTAKDIVLALIRRHGTTGGENHMIEFAGSVARAMSIEERLTLCNMAVEFGAWTGLIAADDATFEYLAGRPLAPSGEAWERSVRHWRGLRSDDDAPWDKEIDFDVSAIKPMVTWGVTPAQGCLIGEPVPDPDAESQPERRSEMRAALDYMDLKPGQLTDQIKIDAAFIGSCTNARLSDLRAAAHVVRGRHVAPGVQAIVVPGSTQVKALAEAEGLDRIFLDAGFEWRESGCSMCFYAGGDSFGPARRVISSTNRNFQGRQGPGVRTHLASPASVASSAIQGRITAADRFVE